MESMIVQSIEVRVNYRSYTCWIIITTAHYVQKADSTYPEDIQCAWKVNYTMGWRRTSYSLDVLSDSLIWILLKWCGCLSQQI